MDINFKLNDDLLRLKALIDLQSHSHVIGLCSPFTTEECKKLRANVKAEIDYLIDQRKFTLSRMK